LIFSFIPVWYSFIFSFFSFSVFFSIFILFYLSFTLLFLSIMFFFSLFFLSFTFFSLFFLSFFLSRSSSCCFFFFLLLHFSFNMEICDKQQKQRKRKFLEVCLSDDRYKSWISQVLGNNSIFHCNVCNKDFSCN